MASLILHLRGKFPVGSIRQRLISGAFWSLTGSVLSRGFTLVASILIARLLGKEGFGEWGLLLSMVSVLTPYASFGIGVTAPKYVAQHLKTEPAKVGRILALLTIFSAAGIVLTGSVILIWNDWIATVLLASPGLSGPVSLSVLLLLTMTIAQSVQGVLAGFHQFRAIASANLIQGVTLAAVFYPLTVWGGISGVVLATSFSYGCALIYNLWNCWKLCRSNYAHLRFDNAHQELHSVWADSLPIILASAIGIPAYYFGKVIVARTDTGVADLGGFEAATQWHNIILFVPQAVKMMTVPILSSLKNETRLARYRRVLWFLLGLNLVAALLIAIPVAVFSPYIMGLYGEGFQHDWELLVIMAIVAILRALKEVLLNASYSLDKAWVQFGIATTWGLLTLGCSIALVPTYGVHGYVIAILIGAVFNIVAYAITTGKAVRAHLELNSSGMP